MSDTLQKVTGFRIKKFVSTEGRSEKDPGKIQIVLEASKDDVRVLGFNIGDVVGAFNMHQTATEPVILQIRFPEEE